VIRSRIERLDKDPATAPEIAAAEGLAQEIADMTVAFDMGAIQDCGHRAPGITEPPDDWRDAYEHDGTAYCPRCCAAAAIRLGLWSAQMRAIVERLSPGQGTVPPCNPENWLPGYVGIDPWASLFPCATWEEICETVRCREVPW
jgi:hypothetical protein